MAQQKVQDLKLDEFLRMVDVATTFRKKQEEVNEQLDIHKVRDNLKKKLQETAQVTGEVLTDFQIESAINSYFEGLYSFQESPRDFSTKIAEIYVDRVRLGKKFGIPALVGLATAGAIWLGAEITHSIYLTSQERNTEEIVELAYQERQKLSMEAREIQSSPFIDKLPKVEKEKIGTELANSKQRLTSMDSFFQKYCSNGTAEDDITKKNYQEAKNGLEATNDSLKKVKAGLENGRLIIKTQEGLTITRRNLETIIKEIHNLNPAEIFAQRAERTYSSGIGEIDRRNLNGAKQKEKELVEVKQGISQFLNLTSQTESLYQGIRAVSKEKEALQKGEALYKEARQLAASAEVQRLAQTVSHLEDLNLRLNQEYTLRIINKPNVKSGMDRYYTDKDGKRASGFYLIVEGVDSSGNPVKMNIRNEENGRTEQVTMWGERISREVYERVKQDKIDNGIIEDNIVGKKRRGYLAEEITMQGVTKKGQITRW